MNILLLEPFYTGSHARWAKNYAQYSQHKVTILSLKGKYWKWRMHGGAVTLARQFLASEAKPDLILATDMLDLSTFLALTRSRTAHTPVVTYFHENQLTYPWSPTDQDKVLKRDNHYSFLNYTTALASDGILFNSQYHLDSFIQALPKWLKAFPDYKELDSIAAIHAKSKVLYLGMDLKKYVAFCPDPIADLRKAQKPLILWNHRWEYDKNPTDFFQALFVLAKKGIDFNLVVLGEHYKKQPPIFQEAKQKLAKHILHWGYTDSEANYAKWLWLADILPVTSYQDFFGGSIVEAIYCNTYPILPKRLAYPEHIPEAVAKNHFYTNFAELVQLLEQSIQQIKVTRATKTQGFVQHYDWEKMVGLYDQLFFQYSQNTLSAQLQ